MVVPLVHEQGLTPCWAGAIEAGSSGGSDRIDHGEVVVGPATDRYLAAGPVGLVMPASEHQWSSMAAG
jgi:hypothetical protein